MRGGARDTDTAAACVGEVGNHGVFQCAGSVFYRWLLLQVSGCGECANHGYHGASACMDSGAGKRKNKEVYGKDRERIEAGKIIAVLENPAETEDVLLLEEALQDFCLTDSCVHGILFPEHLALGSIQAVYVHIYQEFDGLS